MQVQLAKKTNITATDAVYVTTYQYDDAHNTVVTTDPRGNDPADTVAGQTLTQDDGLGRLQRETVDYSTSNLGLNLSTVYTYDPDGNQASVTDPTGSTVTNVYNGLDELIETIDPPVSPGVQYKQFVIYDGDGNVAEQIDARNVVSTTSYDNLNRVVAQNVFEFYSDGDKKVALTSYTYLDTGTNYGGYLVYTVTVTDADSNATSTEYDALGRPVVVTDPYQNTIVSIYNGVNLLSQTDQNKNETFYHYDVDNRLIETDEYDAFGTLQATTKVEYLDAENQVIQVGPRSVGGALVETITQNDSLGREVSQSVENSSLAGEYGTSTVVLVQNVYDGDGNLVLTVDADGNETKYVYDGANRQIEMIEGYGSTVQAATNYTYDKVGDLVSVKDARPHGGPTQAFPQDPNNPAPASFDVYYTYDALHRMVTETDGAGDTTRYTYDGDNNVTSKTNPNGNTTFYTSTTNLATSCSGSTKATRLTRPSQWTNSATSTGDAAPRRVARRYPIPLRRLRQQDCSTRRPRQSGHLPVRQAEPADCYVSIPDARHPDGELDKGLGDGPVSANSVPDRPGVAIRL